MTTTPAVTQLATLTTDPTTRFRRVAGGLALPLAFGCQLVANTVYAVVTGDGPGDTGTGDQTLAFYAEFADETKVITLVVLAGCLLAIPGLLAALRALRPHRPRLALVAVLTMITGYVCYFGMCTTNFDTVALATLHPDLGDVIDASQAMPESIPVFLLFVVGNLIGTLLLGLAVLLSRALPSYAGALIIGWPVGHIINIAGGGEWFAVGGGALEVAGLCIVAVHVLRTPDSEWTRRG